MAINKAPTHRIDATPIYIHSSDPAWDADRISAELEEIERENRDRPKHERIDPKDHPVMLYRSGDTRFDLDAVIQWRGEPRRVTEWFKPGETPIKFVLRRLGYDEFYRVSSRGSDSVQEMCVAACELGLREVIGAPDLEIDPDRKRRSRDEMQTLFDVDPEFPIGIGVAVLAASRSLKSAEKKR